MSRDSKYLVKMQIDHVRMWAEQVTRSIGNLEKALDDLEFDLGFTGPENSREEVAPKADGIDCPSAPSKRAARIRKLYDEGVPLIDGSGKQVGTMHETCRNK